MAARKNSARTPKTVGVRRPESKMRWGGQGIGARQKAMLEKMQRYGEGTYKPEWYLSHADELVLQSLVQRGLVSKVRSGFGKAVYKIYDAQNPETTVRFCGAAMGGYGTYETLGKDEAVLELIVPAHMVSGHSINDLNSPEYRAGLAAMLLRPAEEQR